ncbi:tolB protein precursor [Fulvivirga imtechensis AK7]|uniref:TolB protein n=1 Tax=Fulvivirga imtechensis AK7 TaxID=1237149 RepID=L8JMX7_9BACT|nr:basic secretory protein-like protein [Fulvivirga imtechensis]ELR69593.1 tolB protein precursor [Fulvivirga imtechensis AK7]
MKVLQSLMLFVLCFTSLEVTAQYFGRNKPKYDKFNFDVVKTPHFDIYHYFDNPSLVYQLSEISESWYKMHQEVLKDTLQPHNPILLYRNHADFQQTNAISSAPGIGTGGVTEAFKNRVIMPVTESNAQTDHVLGHELVHAFQYNMIIRSDDPEINIRSLANIPLWMVEGMAEYMSIGSKDPHTAMWMRDAVINNDIPSIRDLTISNKYFPYRYGQAFWAFLANTWGDTIIKPVFIETARLGYEAGIQKVFNFDHATLSEMWKQSLKDYYLKYKEENNGPLIGHRILSEKTAGRINISPAVSPNGQYLAFLSEKDLFTIDLFLADARTGEIIRKLTTTSQASHIDAISFLESAGAWSPDSRQFAYVVFDNGKNQIVITDVASSKIVKKFAVPGVPALNNITWSPKGDKLAFTGLVNGQSDLYVYHFQNGKVDQITNDYYSDIQPSWLHDNESILFTTDRKRTPTNKYTYGSYQLAFINTSNKEVQVVNLFPGADNFNPVVSPDGESIYFVSNRDGFRNLYKYEVANDKVYRLTNYFTGISGITPSAPVLSIAREKDLLAYVYYSKGQYAIFSAPLGNFIKKEVNPQAVEMSAAYLPPYNPAKLDIVDQNLQKRFAMRDSMDVTIKQVPYKPKFQLDYIGSTGVGITTSRFGTGMAGGVDAIFSDILGDKQLYTSLALNGEVYDFGGQVVFLNRERRLQWAFGASHIPYRYGWYTLEQDSLIIQGDTVQVENLAINIRRIFEQELSGFLFYPISKTKRLEFQGSHAWYSNRLDRINNYYYRGYRVGEKQEKDLPAPSGYTIQRVNAALVSDNSYFGLTAPLKGHRYRLQGEQFFGKLEIFTTLADYRKYVFVKPFAVAFRGYHYARYGRDANSDLLPPIFLGAPGVIRGYSTNTFYDPGSDNLNINDLLGSRVVVGNLEIRLPFTGPRQIAMIESRVLFTDLNLFFDAGYAWNEHSTSNFGEGNITEVEDRKPIFSTGFSLRLNLFGAMVIEPYYAFPLSRENIRGEFGINFLPGW